MLGLPALARHAWLRLVGEFPRLAWRWWSGLRWCLRIIALGAAILVVMLAARLMPGVWQVSIDGAGFAVWYGTLVVSGYPRIGNVKDPAIRAGARPAAVIGAAGALLATAGMFLEIFSVPRWSAHIAVAGAVLLLVSVVTFAVVSEVTRAVRFFGRAAVATATLLLATAVLFFPPIIVFLMTSGRWPAPLLGGPLEPSWMDLMSVVPPAVLLLVPQVLRGILTWEDAEKETQQVLSAWIAGIAIAFTCGYALALHFCVGNPVTMTPLSGLAVAILFVGVFLWPLYRLIAKSCWRLGIVDAVKINEWRNDQRAAVKDLRNALRMAQATRADQASGSDASPAAVPVPSSRHPLGAQQHVPTASPGKAPDG